METLTNKINNIVEELKTVETMVAELKSRVNQIDIDIAVEEFQVLKAMRAELKTELADMTQKKNRASSRPRKSVKTRKSRRPVGSGGACTTDDSWYARAASIVKRNPGIYRFVVQSELEAEGCEHRNASSVVSRLERRGTIEILRPNGQTAAHYTAGTETCLWPA